MAGPLAGLIEKRTLRRWRNAAERVENLEPTDLKALRNRAKALSRQVDRVLHVAEGRLALPIVRQAAIRRPMHSDWAWRPELWRGPVKPNGFASIETKTPVGREAKVFHDCMLSEIALRQVRNTRAEDVAAYGVRLDVFRFDGSFLSLVVDLPPEGVDGLSRRHLMRLEIRVETEKPLEIFGRLNIRHGPNVEQLVREFEASNGEFTVEFDLAATRMNETRVERAWLDLIFEGPEMNEIVLRDVTLSRRPRAEF
ncbi:DUF6478 family protein [Rhodobacteraceae bacterium]|nr:DUF6478 family protein [Paracoccaceae bacterium]